MALCPNGAQGDSPGQSEAPPWVWYATKVACPERAEQADKSVPSTRCGARSDASKQAAQIGARHPVRGQVDASKRAAKSVPGTRCSAGSDASKQADKSVPGTRCSDARQVGARHQVRGYSPGRMLANKRSNQCSGQISARHQVRHQVRRQDGC